VDEYDGDLECRLVQKATLRQLRVFQQQPEYAVAAVAIGGHDVAYVHPDPAMGSGKDYRIQRRTGRREILLWADAARSVPLARVTTVAAGRRQCTYVVQDHRGNQLAEIVVDRAGVTRPRRTRWTVRVPAGSEAIGYKGRILWWVVWWLIGWPTFPLAVLSIFSASSADPIRMPLRMIVRTGSEMALDYRGMGYPIYQLGPAAWDSTVTAAVVALHMSYESWLGQRWDIGEYPRTVSAGPESGRHSKRQESAGKHGSRRR
jgi:hypothetical protein